jgi:signal transduction histidine kinase
MEIEQNKRLEYRLVLYIFTSVAIIFLFIISYNYYVSRKMVVKNLKVRAEDLTSRTVNEIGNFLSIVEKVPDNFSKIIEDSHYSKEEIKCLLHKMVENNNDIFGAAIAFEPYYFDTSTYFYSPYYFRDKGKIKMQDLGTEQYDYFLWDWYSVPENLEKAVWSEPYFDEGGGNVLMTTYTVPLYQTKYGKKEFIGVLTADVTLDRMQNYFDSIKVFKTGYAFMISRKGAFIAHPRKDLIQKQTIFSLAEKNKSKQLKEIGQNMVNGVTKFEVDIDYYNVNNNKPSWIAYAPVKKCGWSVGIVFPIDEFIEDVNNLFLIIFLLLAVGLSFILFMIFLISHSITSPLRLLSAAADKFGSGDFNVVLPEIKTNDEIGQLNSSFIVMQTALSTTINDLRITSEELKESNAKLEKYSNNLEDQVEARTRELKATQNQLIQSEKMASLGQLTAGIAHEIKNPLNFVNNFAELSNELAGELKEDIAKIDGKIDPDTIADMKEISDNIGFNCSKILEHGKRADSIIKGMLLHSRGKTGDKQLTDINTLLDESINLAYHSMRGQYSGFNIKIEKEYDTNIGTINVVPQDLSRVFLNTINNACYSTNLKKNDLKDSYSPVLKVQTKNMENKVEIKIWDNGVGIPQDIINKIFNPFFTTKPAGKGTGLGLSLSYDIVVQEHQGEIKVVTKEKEFAEFIIIIPKTL